MNDFENVYPFKKCEFEVNNSLVTVLYKKEKLTFIEKTFFKKQSSKPYKIDLDEIGSFIWKLCDGKKNINEITKISSDHFQHKIEPAKERVEMFFKQMHKNKLLDLYIKKDS
ncbi:MAG: PqqD family protein [Ignavibacteriales bacterium]|nr:PqqD family protein [Ignavibacteriales bacterium]